MNAYMNVWASLMNVAKRFKDAHPEYNFEEIQDFDSVDGDQMPAGNLTGIYQFDYSEAGSLIYAQAAFPVSIEDGSDIAMLNKAVGDFSQFINSNTLHPFYDFDSEAVIGAMRARDELTVSPMIKTKSRQYKFILQGFVFDRTSSYAP